MSEAQELDSPITATEEKIENSTSTTKDQPLAKAPNEEDPERQKSENTEEPRKFEAKENLARLPNDKMRMEKNEDKKMIDEGPTSPTTKILEQNKAGECNLLPVLVEQLRSALEQSCSSQSSISEEENLPREDSGINSEEDLRVWASGLCNSMEEQKSDDRQSPKGLKLDLKFLEDLLLSDIQTALGRLQETLKRVDIGTLTRYSSTLDPTNKLNLLKLISSLLANLKIPEEANVKAEKTAKSQTIVGRRKRAERHTIGVSSEELARARKWLEDKSPSPNVIEIISDTSLPNVEISTETNNENFNAAMRKEEKNISKDNEIELLDSQNNIDKSYEKMPEKYMKNALNEQQSMQNKNIKDTTTREMNIYHHEPNGKNFNPLIDTSYKDDNTIINEEYGISASSLYHQSNSQAKCNKFLAKKSKIKRANTIDIPNYLKLQAESLANGHSGGCVSLRRPINIGDKYSSNCGNVIPSFEPKTENDRKFLALISKNNESTIVAPATNLPYKSFNYRQISAVADKNWNSRFSNIKTTFDKPRMNIQDDNVTTRRGSSEARRKSQSGEHEIVVGSLRLPYNNKEKSTFSHAPSSPFQKIEKPNKDETTPGFLKPGYLSKNGSMLQAKVKIFDNENNSVSAPISPLPTRSRGKQFNAKRGSNLFVDTDEQNGSMNDNSSSRSRIMENGHLNYHSFCKQFAPFATKNPTDSLKSNPWSHATSKSHSEKAEVEKFQNGSKKLTQFSNGLNDNKSKNVKVPVAYHSGDHCEKNERKEKLRHRKLYETFDGHVDTVGIIDSRDIVAYPFEINYEKRSNFGKKIHDVSTEKVNYEDPENVRSRNSRSSPPSATLQYIKSALPSVKNPSPPPRGIFSMQSVAVQTQQTEPPRSLYTSENRTNFRQRDDSLISRRSVAAPPSSSSSSSPPQFLAKDVSSVQGRNLSNEATRRNVNLENARVGSRNYGDNHHETSQREDLPQFVGNHANYPGQGRSSLPQNSTTNAHSSLPANYQTSVDYKSSYYPIVEHDSYSSQNSHGQPPPQIPVRANPPNRPISSVLKNQNDEDNEKFDKKTYNEFENYEKMPNYQDYNEAIFYRDNQNPIYVPPNRNIEREKFIDNSSINSEDILPSICPSTNRDLEREKFFENSTINSGKMVPETISYSGEILNNPDDARSYDEVESVDISEDQSFTEDENIENQDISSTEGVVTRYTCAIATVSPVPESPILSPLPPPLNEPQLKIFDENLPNRVQGPSSKESQGSRIFDENLLNRVQGPPLKEPQGSRIFDENLPNRVQGPSSKEPQGSRIFDENLPNRVQGPSSKEPQGSRIFDENLPNRVQGPSSKEPKGSRIFDENLPLNQRVPEYKIPYVKAPIYREEKFGEIDESCLDQIRRHNLLQQNLIRQLQGDQTMLPKIVRRLSQESSSIFDVPKKLSNSEKIKLAEEQEISEPVIESNNTQDKINIFEGRSKSMRKQQPAQQFKPLSIPHRNEMRDAFVTPKINIVSPSKVFQPNFKTDAAAPRGGNGVGKKLSQKVQSSVDSSDEYLMSCASKPSRSIVLSKSESWHQLAMSKSTLQVPQTKPCSLLKPPKPKSPSSLKLNKQYEASSSSDTIKKMEEKIQRYFQGPSSSSQPDSPIPSRRDSKSKRNFNSRKNPQGTLMRSHTMPHIYDETNDVEKAFDSLFKEATRADNRF